MLKRNAKIGTAIAQTNVLILSIICFLTTVVDAQSDTSLSAKIASSTDDQTISVDGYQVLSDPSITHNLTLSGKGNESVLDLSERDFFLVVGSPSEPKRLWLRNLVIKDCLRIYAYADIGAENCRFENASLDVIGGSFYAKGCTFTGGRLKTCSDHGGTLTLPHSRALLERCRFFNNSAFLNASASGGSNCIGDGNCDGGSGGAISMTNSSMVLLDPTIDGNIASSAGGICVINSDLRIWGGRVTNNLALPINYTNPVGFFSGEGGAISAVGSSKVTLIDTLVSGNRARVFPDIYSEDSSEVKLTNAKIFDNREI